MDSKTKKSRWITIAVFAIGIALICIGIARGETVTVLNKATSICMQCIGID